MDFSTIINILIAIFAFGVIIFIHELGHFSAAKFFKVKVNEFAIGMGPKLISKTRGDTTYSIRAIPFGGFINMEGEDEESDDEHSFSNLKAYKRFIIVVAGAVMNLILGFIILFVVTSSDDVLTSTTIAEFTDGALSQSTGLEINDEVIAVDGNKVYVASDMIYLILRTTTGEVDLTVIRDGEEVLLKGVMFERTEVEGSSIGELTIDFKVYGEENTLSATISETINSFISNARMVWMSLFDIITGRYGINEMSGPIGATAVISQASSMGIMTLLTMLAFITINLGVFNLLPLPALDGGRLFFILIEMIRRKKINPKYEGYVHFAGFALLMSLMVFLSFNDIVKLITGVL